MEQEKSIIERLVSYIQRQGNEVNPDDLLEGAQLAVYAQNLPALETFFNHPKFEYENYALLQGKGLTLLQECMSADKIESFKKVLSLVHSSGREMFSTNVRQSPISYLVLAQNPSSYLDALIEYGFDLNHKVHKPFLTHNEECSYLEDLIITGWHTFGVESVKENALVSLLHYGADLQRVDSNGDNIVSLVVKRQNPLILKTIFQHSSTAMEIFDTAKNPQGMTALDIALEYQQAFLGKSENIAEIFNFLSNLHEIKTSKGLIDKQIIHKNDTTDESKNRRKI